MMDMTTASVSTLFTTTPKNDPLKAKHNKKKPKNRNVRNDNINAAVGVGAAHSNPDDTNLVRITNIKSPENFYVQNVNSIEMIRKLSLAYLRNEVEVPEVPLSISQGCYYMTYHVIDKQWYRGVIEKVLPNDLFKVFLIDFGLTTEVSKEK